jgi:hypothetical protein
MTGFFKVFVAILDIASAIYLFQVFAFFVACFLGKRDDEDNIQNVFFLPRNKFWFVAIALLAMATLVLSFDYRKSIWG